jgi:hypothetical protein
VANPRQVLGIADSPRRLRKSLDGSKLKLDSGNSYAEALTDYSFFARNSESEEVAGPQLSADYYALPGRQNPSWMGCNSR